MTKRPTVAVPRSLPPERAIPILEEHIRKGDPLRLESYDSSHREEWAQTGEGALRAALGSDHPVVQKFRAAQCGTYSAYDTPETLKRQADRMLSDMLAVLRSAVEQLRWELPDPRQVFMPAGSQHDAYVEIRSIVQQAGVEVFIIDPWVDETLWPLLKNIPPACKVRIL